MVLPKYPKHQTSDTMQYYQHVNMLAVARESWHWHLKVHEHVESILRLDENTVDCEICTHLVNLINTCSDNIETYFNL